LEPEKVVNGLRRQTVTEYLVYPRSKRCFKERSDMKILGGREEWSHSRY